MKGNDLYDKWYGQHQQDYGAAVFHALLATIGMFEDRMTHKIDENTIYDGEFESINGVELIPIEGLHYKLPVFGYRIKDFVYLTDVSFVSEREKEKMKGAEVIVLDALRKIPHISHFTMEQAVELLEELKPKQGYLIHISHLMGKHNEVVKELPNFIKPAHDGLILEL